MSLDELRAGHRAGAIEKQEYIARMHERHALLFEYASFLAGTEIEAIEITEGTVTMRVRDSGLRIACDFQDRRTAPIDALNFGAYEPAELAMILRLVEPGSTVFDIGANIGWYSLRIAAARPDARVLAFEPVPATCATLRANVERNRCPNVVVHQFGFSDTAGPVRFFVYPDIAVNASMADHHSGGPSAEVTCEVRTIDEFVATSGERVDLVKCDIEGAELLALRGGLATIEAQRPVIFAEMLRKWSADFGYHPNDIIDLLGGAGYRCFTIGGDGLAELTTMDDETVETNFLFLHGTSHAARISRHLTGG